MWKLPGLRFLSHSVEYQNVKNYWIHVVVKFFIHILKWVKLSNYRYTLEILPLKNGTRTIGSAIMLHYGISTLLRVYWHSNTIFFSLYSKSAEYKCMNESIRTTDVINISLKPWNWLAFFNFAWNFFSFSSSSLFF